VIAFCLNTRFEEEYMRKFALLSAVAAILSVGTMLPSNAVAGCYRLGETGYHWYRSCWGPRFIYPHHQVCRHGHCWYR
jgi:hypothetical protein